MDQSTRVTCVSYVDYASADHSSLRKPLQSSLIEAIRKDPSKHHLLHFSVPTGVES